jgi:hypothetical protein
MWKKSMWLPATVIFLMTVYGAMAYAAQGDADQTKPPVKETKAGNKTIRVLVIGGMTMTGLWQEIAGRFEKETG